MEDYYKAPDPGEVIVPVIPLNIMKQRAKIQHFDIQAKVIRANGDIEDYGVIAGFDKNPIKHLLLQIKILITRVKIKYGLSFNKRG